MSPTILGTSGTGYFVPGLPYATVRAIMLERITTSLPEGVSVGGGSASSPAWIEFTTPATDPTVDQGGGPGTGQTWSLDPDNVESVLP